MPHGLEFLVVNPLPLDWNDKTLHKNDTLLSHQLESLNLLGRLLRETGVTLAYHTHDSEMAGGDLDYPALAGIIRNKGVSPLIVNEQIPSLPAEAFLSMSENYRKSAEIIRKWFTG